MSLINPYEVITEPITDGFDYVFSKITTMQSKREQRQMAIALIAEYATKTFFDDQKWSETYFTVLRQVTSLLVKKFPIPEKEEADLSTWFAMNRLLQNIQGPHFDKNAKIALDINIRHTFEMEEIREDLYISLTSLQACCNFLLNKDVIRTDKIMPILKANVRGTLSGLFEFKSIQLAMIAGVTATAFTYIAESPTSS